MYNDAMINTGNKYVQILKVFGYCQLAKYQTKFNMLAIMVFFYENQG